jgi:hypothetical protein
MNGKILRFALLLVVAVLGALALVEGAHRVAALHGMDFASALHGTAAAARKETKADGWPDTPAGARARGWVEAFNTDEKAMGAWVAENVTTDELAKRNVPQRVEKYKKLREQYGVLVLGSIEKSTQLECKASLMASDATIHKFVFTVEKNPPHKLVSVGIEQLHFMHGGHGFGH